LQPKAHPQRPTAVGEGPSAIVLGRHHTHARSGGQRCTAPPIESLCARDARAGEALLVAGSRDETRMIAKGEPLQRRQVEVVEVIVADG
jgi:hypothetical protein